MRAPWNAAPPPCPSRRTPHAAAAAAASWPRFQCCNPLHLRSSQQFCSPDSSALRHNPAQRRSTRVGRSRRPSSSYPTAPSARGPATQQPLFSRCTHATYRASHAIGEPDLMVSSPLSPRASPQVRHHPPPAHVRLGAHRRPPGPVLPGAGERTHFFSQSTAALLMPGQSPADLTTILRPPLLRQAYVDSSVILGQTNGFNNETRQYSASQTQTDTHNTRTPCRLLLPPLPCRPSCLPLNPASIPIQLISCACREHCVHAVQPEEQLLPGPRGEK